jgi:hypothetical protein
MVVEAFEALPVHGGIIAVRLLSFPCYAEELSLFRLEHGGQGGRKKWPKSPTNNRVQAHCSSPKIGK